MSIVGIEEVSTVRDLNTQGVYVRSGRGVFGGRLNSLILLLVAFIPSFMTMDMWLDWSRACWSRGKSWAGLRAVR